MKMVRGFWRDENGATSIEYALIAGIISLAIIGGATAIGTKLAAKFTPISGNLS